MYFEEPRFKVMTRQVQQQSLMNHLESGASTMNIFAKAR
jgi:hypothetical protein